MPASILLPAAPPPATPSVQIAPGVFLPYVSLGMGSGQHGSASEVSMPASKSADHVADRVASARAHSLRSLCDSMLCSLATLRLL